MLRKAISFGVFAALSLALTFYIGAQIAHFKLGTERYGLTATFDDVTNLRAGDPVRLAGVPVGQVSAVKVVDGRAQVRFQVDKSVSLPSDSEVAVRWLNLIGQRELYLYPGTSTDTITKDGKQTMGKTRSVVDLGALLNELGPLTQAIDPKQVNSLVEALATALDGNRTQLDAVVADLRTVLDTFASRKDTIQQLITDYATVTGTIAKRDLEIQTMVDNLASLSAAFADSSQTLDTALVQLPALAAGLQTLLSANEQQLGSTLDSLAQISDTVHAHLGDLTTILEQFPSAEQALLRSTSYGEFVLINAVCISPTAPPCPTPIILAANAKGSGALNSTASISNALLGGMAAPAGSS
ncbi:MAG: phospholipid/cholesterol/gamma-HCH transport system substrate-binding protein [Acidimicrobiaceae bacterium]|jgi:phospholipid/cholesterol/gamma-HCH transport system substrate-binding protein